VLDAIVSVAVTFVTRPKPVEELNGLVYGMAIADEHEAASERVWYRRPATLAAGALGLTAILSVIFA
jgi:solute:Na+ symporter, SSS family